MQPHAQIVEVIRIAEQGLSKPYVCKADDGLLYYVKSQRACQVREWLGWHLAHAFELPVAECAILELSEDLWEELPREFRSMSEGLQCGTLFGSREAPHCRQFELSDIARVDPRLQQRCLLFDVWIANEDRLKENPNLLWSEFDNRLVVIDHNNAFKFDNPHAELIEQHIFSDQWQAIAGADLATRAEQKEMMAQALHACSVACHNLPPEWRWANPQGDIPFDLEIDAIPNMLSRYTSHQFWRET